MGKKTEGWAWPEPHSESVKVLGPKWRNMAMLPSCHESCREVGRGKMGRGGGFRCEEEDKGVEDNSERRMRMKVGVANLGFWVLGL